MGETHMVDLDLCRIATTYVMVADTFALQAAAGCNRPVQPISKQRKLQPPQPCALVTQAASRHQPQPAPSSTWAEFVETEAETGEAAAGLHSQTSPLTTPDSTQKSPPHITGVHCRYGLQPEGLAVPAPGSDAELQAQHCIPRCTSIRPCEMQQAGGTDSQQSQADEQPRDGGNVLKATPTTSACKPLMPVFAKHKRHGFKPPAPVPPGLAQASQCKPSTQQTNSSVQAAHSAGNKPVFVFDGLHPPSRHVAVPMSFSSLHSYQKTWCAAVTEEVNIRCTPQLCRL